MSIQTMAFNTNLMRLCGAIGAVAVLAGQSVTAVQAATVQAEGVSLLNSGKGFNRINGSTEGLPGDVVMVKSGKTRIVYATGCVEEVVAGKTYTILPEDKCVVTLKETPATPTTTPVGTPPPAAVTAGIAPEVIIGGAVVAAGVGAAIALSGSSSKSSP